MKFSLKTGYLIQEIADEKILIAGAADTVNYTQMLVLNDSAAELIQILIDQEATEEELVESLTDRYAVTAENAKEDVKALLIELDKQDILKKE